MIISSDILQQLNTTRNSQMFQYMIELSKDAVVVTNAQLEIVYTNRTTTELLSKTKSGDSLQSILHAQDHSIIDQITDGARSSGFFFASQLNGFYSIIDQYQDVQVIASIVTDWDRENSYSSAINILNNNPSGTLDVIWAASDEIALGAIKAVKEMGRENDVKVFSNSVTSELVNEMRNGCLVAETYHGFPELGWYSTQFAVMLALGEEVPPSFDIQPRAVYQSNIHRYSPTPILPPIDWDSIKSDHQISNTIDIGWIQTTDEGVYKGAINYFDVATADARAHGIPVNVITHVLDDSDDFSSQVDIIDNFIHQGVDVIVLPTLSEGIIKKAIRQANKFNIPVIVVNQLKPLEDVDVACYIGLDNIAAGQISGYSVVNYLGGPGPLGNRQLVPIDASINLDMEWWNNLYSNIDPHSFDIQGNIAVIEGISGDWRGELSLIHVTGKPIPVDCTATSMFDDLGQFAGVIFSFRDISEQLKTRQRLQESERMLQTVLDTLPLRVFWKDRDLNLVGCNQAFADDVGIPFMNTLLDMTNKEIIEQQVSDPQYAEQDARFHADDLEVMDTGIPKIGYEESQLRSDGKIYWLRTSKMPLRNADGEIIGVLGVYDDITDQKQAAQRLRDDEERFRKTIEATVEAIILYEQGTILDVNPAFEEIFGYSKAEAIGMQCTYLHPDESKDLMVSLVQSQENVSKQQMLGCRKDGSVFEIIVHIRPIIYLGQQVQVVALHDISEQLETQRRLQESENMLQIILDTIPTRVFWKDKDFRLIGCNRSFVNDAGVASAETLINKVEEEFIEYRHKSPGYIEQSKKYRADDREVMQTGIPKIGYEEKQTRDDGKTYWVRTSKLPLHNANGEIIGLLGAYEDITEHKLAVEALRESEDWFRNISDLVTAAFSWIYDEQEKDWRLEKMIGTLITDRNDSGPTTQSSITIRTHPDDRSRMLADIQETIAGRVTSGEYRLINKNGDISWAQIKRKPQWDDNKEKVIRYFAATENITERKNAENEIRQLNLELEQRIQARTLQLQLTNQELESFAYSVSHDLRAPLRSIAGFSQALLEDYHHQLDEEGQDFLSRINKATLRMGNLIDDMLQLSRVTRREMRLQNINLSMIVEEILNTLSESDPERDIVWDIMPDVFAYVDSGLILISLDNLLRNAWKFTSKQDRARIEFGYEQQGDEQVYYVRDDGVGFDMIYADKLFGTFQRLHSASEFEGTGIGLATVQRIIHRHGGQIWAESVVEEGTTFFFTIAPESSLES